MVAIPSVLALAGSIRCTAWPRTTMFPASGVSAPVLIFPSVDLPAPFSPTSAWTSPAARSNDTRRSACTPANDLEMEIASSSGGDTRGDDSRRPGAWGAGRLAVLPDETQTELHRAAVGGGRDGADRDVRDVEVRRAEVHVIQQVEH